MKWLLTWGYFIHRVMAMFKKDLRKLKTQNFGFGPIIMSLIIYHFNFCCWMEGIFKA
jgi:hypothetical protein